VRVGEAIPAIAAALDVSIKYAGDVRARSSVRYPRHWVKLAELVGITGSAFGSHILNPNHLSG
jgi:hypothetical protein